MKAKQSPLKVIDFLVINSRLKFNAPSSEVNIKELFTNYSIDIDFARANQGENYQIFMKIAVNEDAPPKEIGYSIFAEVVGIFSLDKNGLSKEEIENYSNYTSLIITINHLRNFISNLTSYAPFGKYVLPSIDMRDLISQKVLKIKNATNNKRSQIKRQPAIIKNKVIKKPIIKT
jgi:preprotein translocase subunit SecB